MAETTAGLHRSIAATQLRLVMSDMLQLRAGLVETMPGKMDALSSRIETWCKGIAPAIRELERRAPTEGDE